MVALAVRHDAICEQMPPTLPAESTWQWGPHVPVIRSFPRLAADAVEAPLIEARSDEEPERWDGMA
jgi:hypothetical protein